MALSDSFESRVKRHQREFRAWRGSDLSGEDATMRLLASVKAHVPEPIGQALAWYNDMIWHVPRSGMIVGLAIAAHCGDDSQVSMPWRSLADAVERVDKEGRAVAYAQRGAQALVDHGWLSVETAGVTRNQKTTFYLEPGALSERPRLRTPDAWSPVT